MANRRTLFWLAFLGGAAVLAVIPEFFEPAPEEVVAVAGRSDGRVPQGELRRAAIAPGGGDGAASAPPATLPAERSATPTTDLFAAHSWYVPPPPPPPAAAVAPPPPPPPAAPPLPFQFLGKLADGERLLVFLQRGERVYTVSAGDVIDGTYRVERIAPTRMTIIYLPLNIAQTLSVGSSL